MSKKDAIQAKGVITEATGNCKYLVRLETGITIRAHLSGKIKQAFIKCIPGDEVIVEMSPYDLTLGRICKRLLKGGGPRPPQVKRRK